VQVSYPTLEQTGRLVALSACWNSSKVGGLKTELVELDLLNDVYLRIAPNFMILLFLCQNQTEVSSKQLSLSLLITILTHLSDSFCAAGRGL
jgi:hypothetical protein